MQGSQINDATNNDFEDSMIAVNRSQMNLND